MTSGETKLAAIVASNADTVEIGDSRDAALPPRAAERPGEGTLAGSSLAQFRLVELLGQGGMGQVYRAHDERLDREVALKVIHPASTPQPGFRERMLREARAAAAVSHRHIASVYEVGVEGGQAFIAMELVEGKTLRQVLGAPLPLEEALRLALQMARGLARAHDKRVIHRDLKPENVMVTSDGEVKILDFGIAKREGTAGAPLGTSAAIVGDDPAGTQDGGIVGTPGYMSPEQIRGTDLDLRSDVFAFGATLYEMLTGQPPFGGTPRQRIMRTLGEAPSPPSKLVERLPPALDGLVMRCLARSRDERTASMHDVVRDLSQIAADVLGASAAGTTGPRLSFTGLDVPAAEVSRSRSLPAGPVTLLVTVLAEAALLVERHGEAYPDILGAYHAIAARAAERQGGSIVGAAAEQVIAVFVDPNAALGAAVEAQRAFHAEVWPGGAGVRVRVGLHSGEPKLVGDRYAGLDVHRAVRIAESTPAGQVVISAAARGGLSEGALAGLAIADLGAIRIKDLHYPEHLFALSIHGLVSTRSLGQTLLRGRSRLPEQATTFIGRAKLIAEVIALLQRDDVRLVTLTGPGGTGKTRLSIEVARALEAHFPGGVVQVRLGPVSDPALVLPTIARALDLPEVPGTPPLEVIANGLGAGELLLVLDNFEHVVDAAASVADLLAVCRGLKVLVTSREVLRVRGEREQAVPPMELPPAGAETGFEAIAASEAVCLFVERAREVAPGFVLTAENAPLAAAICARLDAIPLAIELAASRAKMLPLDALHRRLSDRLGFVKSADRDREQRHRTLRATIDWSHDLLDEPSKTLFRRVSVFRGGFSIESAEAVCGGEDLPLDVFEGLSSLAGKSLLTLSEVDGATRMGALETIREYAEERLRQSPDEALLRARHAEHFTSFVESLATSVLGRDWRRHVGPLLTEIDNVRAALDWALAQPDPALTTRLLKALMGFWTSYGRVAEGSAFADRALAQTAGLGATEARAVALEVASWLRLVSGDIPTMIDHSTEGVRTWKALGREAEGGRTAILAGVSVAITRSFPDGIAAVEEAHKTLRARGDRFGTVMALNVLAELARTAGDYHGALVKNQEMMEMLRAMGYVIQSSLFAVNLAWCYLHQGDWARAAEAVEQTLELGRQMNNPYNLVYYLAVMAGVAVVRGQHAEGLRLFGAFDTWLRSFGASTQPADQAAVDGYVAMATAAIGEEAAAAARREGAAWPREEAIARTLLLRR